MTDGDNEPEELRPAPATGGDEKNRCQLRR